MTAVSAASMPLLSAKGLAIGHRLGRDTRLVAEGLDLDLAAGELVCLLGRNGSGKSTLLSTLAGLLPPLAGSIAVEGRPISGLDARARARCMAVVLPQIKPLGPVTGWEVASLGRYAHTPWTGQHSDRDRAVVSAALADAGASALAGRRVATLSDGERQKVSIARALAQEARILLLDEPTAFLDITARAELTALLARLACAGRGVLLSTHDLELALRHADRLWLMSDGGVEIGPPATLTAAGALERAFGPAVAALIGSARNPAGGVP